MHAHFLTYMYMYGYIYGVFLADLLEIVTPDEYMYETLWKSVKNRDYFTFQVKACGDVHVILSNEIGQIDQDIFEFSIGGWNNTQSVLRSSVSTNKPKKFF